MIFKVILKLSSQKLFFHSFLIQKVALEIPMKDIENQKAETSVLRTFGSNVSLATRNKNCLDKCFEMKADAIICTEKKYMDLSSGEKRLHDHTGLGTSINYSEFSRKFDLKFSDGRTPGNAG